MPKKLPADLLDRVIAELRRVPQGAQIDGLAKHLSPDVSRRTLQRKLPEWVGAGAIRAEGTGKGRRYFALHSVATIVGSGDLQSPGPDIKGSGDVTIPLSGEGTEIRGRVRRPIVDRNPVGYERRFLDAYEPNVTAYLPEILLRHLHELGRSPSGPRPAGTYARAILERLLLDLSWASSRLEGNTYSLLETQQLIQEGKVAPGKDAKETQMILNHKAAIELLVDSPEEIGVNRYTILNLHALLADNLLADPMQAGRLRSIPIAIAASTYVPSAIPQLIDELFTTLMDKAAAIRDAFEQSFFLMVQLPYLQPFVDVNKRTSRLAANIPLIRNDMVPLSFIDVPDQVYIDGLIGVYELNRVELLRDVFTWAYERSCRRYKTVRDSLPEPDPFRLKYRDALMEVIGEVVRRCQAPATDIVTKMAAKLVPEPDLQRFVSLVVRELTGLHEGNIARFRLRPAELRAWLATAAVAGKPGQE